MAASQHAWVLEVLHDIIAYADKFGLTTLSATCQSAYAAALLEIDPAPAGPSDLIRQQGFVDTLRDLVDYAEREKLTRTRDFLLQALVSAADHMSDSKLGGVLLLFPRRDED